jgi:hypothetical protein
MSRNRDKKTPVQRSTSIALGGLVLLALALLLWKGGPRAAPPVRPTWTATLPSAAPTPTLSVSILPFTPPSPGLSSPPLASVRPLPPGAPRAVHFGVVLVQYRGAQFAPDSAPFKPDALQRARTLAELARKDFKAAVKQGDPGSDEDVGRIGRGKLEPAPEYELFTLAPGGVSDPIDTPRGYWIARRIE